MKELLVAVIFLVLLSPQILAQDKGVGELDLEELAAVDLEKLCEPTVVDLAHAFSDKTINIGFILPSSKFRELSKELIDGAQLAVDEINNSGLLSDKKLYLIATDDAGVTDYTILKGKELISKYNVAGIIGPTGSSRYIAFFKGLTDVSPVVTISPSVTSVEITTLEDNGLGFRTAASDALQGKTAALYAVKNLHKKTAAIFYLDNVHGLGLAKEFKAHFVKSGGKITGEANYSPLINLNSYNVTGKLADLLKSEPDVLYLVTNNEDAVRISHQIAEAQLFDQYKPILLGCDAMRGNVILENSNLAVLDGMYGTSVEKQENIKFNEKFEKVYGYKPAYIETADTYDIVYLFALAIIQGKATEPQVLASNIISVSSEGIEITADDLLKIKELINQGADINYQGVNSSLDFDKYGDIPDRRYQVWQLLNGRFSDNVAILDSR